MSLFYSYNKLSIRIIAFALFASCANGTPTAFSTSDYLLLQGKFIAWFAANAIAGLHERPRARFAVMLLSSVAVPFSEQISLSSLQKAWTWFVEGGGPRGEFWEHVSIVEPNDAQDYESFIFNAVTKKELDAVVYRALAHARNGLKQSTVLLYGEPGTGKTGVGESLARWPQFKVYRVPSQVLAKAANFRLAASLCRQNLSKPGRVNVILVDDAEFFMRALTPGTSNYHSTAQEELESAFRTILGGDSAHCLWFFTSNQVSDLEGDTQGALKRRFKNQVWVRGPDEATFMRMLLSFTKDAITTENRLLGLKLAIAIEAEDKFRQDHLKAYLGVVPPDSIKQVAENAVQLAVNEAKEGDAVVRAEHWGFFFDARFQSEAWLLERAEKEYRDKRQKLERMVAIRALEKQLEAPRADAEKPPV